MKLFRDIKKWFDNQEHLFYLFLVILIVPNVVLCFTEPISWTAKICNILLPLSIYYAVMAWSRNCGRTFWLLFPFIFFGAFQLVLLYLFGQSIIAVDMFLNLVTTEKFIGRERDMMEISDIQIRVNLPKHSGKQHWLIVLNPHLVTWMYHAANGIAEQLVHFLIRLPERVPI